MMNSQIDLKFLFYMSIKTLFIFLYIIKPNFQAKLPQDPLFKKLLSL